MNIKELIQSSSQPFMEASNGVSNAIHVCVPGVVKSFDKARQTVNVRPLLRMKLDGEYSQLPILNDIPVFFPGGTDCAITYSVKPGDDCLVVFADTDIDGWFLRGNIQNPFVDRKHDLSDGFAFVGFRPLPRSIECNDQYSFAFRMKDANGWKTMIGVTQDGQVRAEGGVFIG